MGISVDFTKIVGIESVQAVADTAQPRSLSISVALDNAGSDPAGVAALRAVRPMLLNSTGPSSKASRYYIEIAQCPKVSLLLAVFANEDCRP